ncbi:MULTISPECIES: DUF3833 domain-containing protein [Idiomarinaceae]|uniref:DUF3833 domain-containing protein n=1 Tax=Pseudidiomarina fusca TaxID=2965078 RepID=A0ABU3KU97_9GAMM|nr:MULTISPECIES: DUF3833 domain-containing protein [Idiomarinaceae]MDT7525041.1 DUF3833 domain-containing protein [Pseudidiomarina sp. GXY010]MRJ40701.1 DUF3833 family protein [Idiomarina sp. FeN1]NCU56505.1 DUF3833 family protein [Idiomarina sp. FenA--70]NCU58885.1 DUF3833 family protein [Idiomarina sp. FenBw--71]UUN14610.1 DUF3833 domain-containing protein [Idiomarina loihiensis]
MKQAWQAMIALMLLVLLVGCSAKLEDYQGEQPQLKLETFFNGDLVAHGIVQDYSGKVIQRFTADLKGTWDGNEGVLDEQFYYADGTRQERIWYLTKTADHTYEGRASDVEGTAIGTTSGNALHWRYTLIIELDGEPFAVDLDDWMYLVDENNMINRTQMYKFGLPVGEITLYIGKRS